MKTNETMKSRRFMLFIAFLKLAAFTAYLGIVLLFLSVDIDSMNLGQFCVFVGVFVGVILIGRLFRHFIKSPNNNLKGIDSEKINN